MVKVRDFAGFRRHETDAPQHLTSVSLIKPLGPTTKRISCVLFASGTKHSLGVCSPAAQNSCQLLYYLKCAVNRGHDFVCGARTFLEKEPVASSFVSGAAPSRGEEN
jgi:hypothetical protein